MNQTCRRLVLAQGSELTSESDRDSSDDSDFYSESDQLEVATTPRPWTLRHAVAGALLLAGAVACLASWKLPETNRSANVIDGAETTSLFETEEFRSLMDSKVQSMMRRLGVKDDRVQHHVNNSVASLTRYIGKHASKSEAQSLRNARLGPQEWETLRALLNAYSDKRVQDVGHAVVQEARANLLAGPTEISKRVAARLQKEHLQGLAQELLPAKLRTALLQRWASTDANEDDIWKTMLDPTGESLARIRENTTSTTIESSALLVSERRLRLAPKRLGPWKGPFTLDWKGLTIGITSVVMLSALEITFHIDLFTHAKHIALPRWVYTMLAIPAFGTGAGSCEIGLSFWCEYFLGVLGANALEGIIVVPLFHGKSPSPSPNPTLYQQYER